MSTNLDKYKSDLERLIKLGESMDLDLRDRHLQDTGNLEKNLQPNAEKLKNIFELKYQPWYTEAFAVIRQLITDRLSEFEHLYKGDGKRKEINVSTYNIQDWLKGVRSGEDPTTGKKYFNDFAIVAMCFRTQLEILRSAHARFKSSLLDIRQIVQADMFDSELDAARELMKNGFFRGAGAIAGVVLEKHLTQVADNHSIKMKKKKHPTLSDLNEMLKEGGVLDVPAWRQIQRLGDIRNLCDHKKEREPTKEEVEELVNEAEKICKTLI